jgi:hypothetical protein
VSMPEVSSRSRLLAFLQKNLRKLENLAGYVRISGTPLDNEVAVFTSADTVDSSGYLTFDKDTGYLKVVNTSEQGDWFRVVAGDIGEGVTIDTSDGYSTTGAPLTLKPNGRVILQPKTANLTSFFQVKDQGGTAFVVGDSTNKRLTLPYQPSFLVYLTSDQTISSDNTFTTIQFTGEAYDTNNDFASYKFTAPVTGKYLFSANARIDVIPAKSTQWVQGKIRNITTGREYSIGLVDLDDGSDYQMITGAVVMTLDASDEVDFQVAIKDVDGTATHVYGQSTLNGIHRTFLSGYLLG